MRTYSRKRLRLPSPYAPPTYLESFSSSAFASDGPGNANAAIYIPVWFPVSCFIASVSVRGTNTTGNYDLGFYDKNFNRLASKGSTAMAAANLTLTLNSQVEAGEVYFVAFACSNTGARYAGYTQTSVSSLLAMGCAEEASALPVPDPGNPGSTLSWQHLPLIAFDVR